MLRSVNFRFTPFMRLVVRNSRAFHLFFSFFFSFVPPCGLALAQEAAFPVLAGLEDAVGFWKQIFTRFSSNEVVFFDPFDPGKIYSVLRIPENEAARAIIDKEQARIIADYDLNDEDGRVRSQRGAKEPFLSGLKISGRYISQMKKIIRAAGIPAELAYLPLVESSFNVRARSSLGAVGLWQFMADTGKKFLRINDAFDERRDPLASTRAAARLLKENYRLLGNWPLAITAYNHGTEGVFRGINAVRSRNLVELIRGYQSPTFGFASKNFYAEFLAAVEVATNSEAYFPFLRAHPPL
ncbi:MAG TPA: lytic transglycosylase domain-containing protein, partial [Candidatus Udaeobacter sp.]|nr:lytic transglycosylase domain-containing protein [Candidatus Udaeobacter sp.]